MSHPLVECAASNAASRLSSRPAFRLVALDAEYMGVGRSVHVAVSVDHDTWADVEEHTRVALVDNEDAHDVERPGAHSDHNEGVCRVVHVVSLAAPVSDRCSSDDDHTPETAMVECATGRRTRFLKSFHKPALRVPPCRRAPHAAWRAWLLGHHPNFGSKHRLLGRPSRAILG